MGRLRQYSFCNQGKRSNPEANSPVRAAIHLEFTAGVALILALDGRLVLRDRGGDNRARQRDGVAADVRSRNAAAGDVRVANRHAGLVARPPDGQFFRAGSSDFQAASDSPGLCDHARAAEAQAGQGTSAARTRRAEKRRAPEAGFAAIHLTRQRPGKWDVARSRDPFGSSPTAAREFLSQPDRAIST